jgi:hypothetical protein
MEVGFSGVGGMGFSVIPDSGAWLPLPASACLCEGLRKEDKDDKDDGYTKN